MGCLTLLYPYAAIVALVVYDDRGYNGGLGSQLLRNGSEYRMLGARDV